MTPFGSIVEIEENPRFSLAHEQLPHKDMWEGRSNDRINA